MEKRRIGKVSSDITARVLGLVSEQILGDSKHKATADTPLLSHGLDLDSVAVLQLIMAVEEEFGVRFEDRDLSIELFRTAGTLADAVARKLSAAGTPG
jgi:acyl carrier protein